MLIFGGIGNNDANNNGDNDDNDGLQDNMHEEMIPLSNLELLDISTMKWSKGSYHLTYLVTYYCHHDTVIYLI
jgi:hypothetical protein